MASAYLSATEAAEALGLEVARLGAEDASVGELLGIGDHGALILRPDGVIGWRSGTDSREGLAEVVARLAARQVEVVG